MPVNRVGWISADMTDNERALAVSRFQQELDERTGLPFGPPSQVLLMSTGVASVGINLSISHAMIQMQPDPDPTRNEQTKDRIHRMNSGTEQSRVFVLITPGLPGEVEEIYLRRCIERQKVLEETALQQNAKNKERSDALVRATKHKQLEDYDYF